MTMHLQPDGFRDAMSRFATGVTVISTLDEDGAPRGITVNSFGSLSLDPPLVQWNIIKTSYSYPVFHRANRFAVNILAADQETVSRNFCKAIDRFATVGIETGMEGLPLISGCAAWIECCVTDEFPGGDHAIFIGQVERCRVFDRLPLIVWRRIYFDMDKVHRGDACSKASASSDG